MDLIDVLSESCFAGRCFSAHIAHVDGVGFGCLYFAGCRLFQVGALAYGDDLAPPLVRL